MRFHPVAGLVRLLTGVRVRWVGCRPSPTPRIYFANHCSNLDAPTLWAALPEELRARCRPVAARDYWTRTPLRRLMAERVFHSVLIERRQPTRRDNPLTEMLSALDADHSLILFPEGGRHPGPEPAPFKSGLYHLARKRPSVELVPVRLENLDRILPKGSLLPAPSAARVTFGTPITLRTGESKEDFLERARRAVMTASLPGTPPRTDSVVLCRLTATFSGA